MKREPKKQGTRTLALTDPKPEFVSLVRAGANQTPFLAVKRDNSQEIDMKLKSETHDIQKLIFSGEKFKDEKSVKGWLEAGGYTGYEVVKEKDGSFSVANKEQEFEGEPKVVEAGEGVTAHVGKKRVAAPAEKAAPAAASAESNAAPVTDAAIAEKAARDAAVKAAREWLLANVEGAEAALKDATEDKILDLHRVGLEKAAQVKKADAKPLIVAQKFDDFMAQFSDGKTLAAVLKDADDGYPGGLWELTVAMYTAMRNNIVAGDDGGVSAVTAEYGARVAKLAAVFRGAPADALKMAQDAQAKFDAANPLQPVAKAAGGKDEPAAPAPAAKTEAAAPAAAAAAATDAGLAEAVKALVKTVSELAGTVKEQKAELDNRVKTLEDEKRQTRRSADATDAGESNSGKSEATVAMEEHRMRSALGISFGSAPAQPAKK
jgi:hypothetical protein